MTDITIPPEAVEAGARAAYEVWRTKIRFEERDTMPLEFLDEVAPEWDDLTDGNKQDWIDQQRSAFLAMVKSWPGGSGELSDKGRPHLILPLKEKPDAE